MAIIGAVAVMIMALAIPLAFFWKADRIETLITSHAAIHRSNQR